jgi:hypothetical protein
MRLIATAAIAVTLASPVAAQNTGMDYFRLCRGDTPIIDKVMRAACAAYETGFASGLAHAGAICLPPNVSWEQIDLVVRDFMRSHPARLNEAPDALFDDALRNAWPCH